MIDSTFPFCKSCFFLSLALQDVLSSLLSSVLSFPHSSPLSLSSSNEHSALISFTEFEFLWDAKWTYPGEAGYTDMEFLNMVYIPRFIDKHIKCINMP